MMDDVVSFGQWLRHLRRTRDLTQVELAQQIGCAASTIEKLEADARRPSKSMAQRLAEVLNLSTEERPTFLHVARTEGWIDIHTLAALADDPSGRPTNESHAPRLPVHPTPLLGREHELATVAAMLQDERMRLVTLTGLGGVGKTRLALEVAGAMTATFPDGVWLIELAPIHDEALVANAIAATLGVRETSRKSLVEGIITFLYNRNVLLVLDNFEHVLAAAPLVSDLLASAPRVSMLVTSRAPLYLRGEHVVPVPPLSTPDPAHASPLIEVAESAAVRLFLARAQAAHTEIGLTEANLRAVAEICRRLDGLPLAIELAAVRATLLPPQAMLSWLEQSLTVLTIGSRDLPVRQQTLRATFDWSYELLDPSAQHLFAHLAVFVGGFTIAAVAHVCALQGESPMTILDGIQVLTDHAFLHKQQRASRQSVPDRESEPRYMMLETIREYALEHLAKCGETPVLQQQHAMYFLALAEEAEPHLIDAEQSRWASRLEADYGNLRTALVWSQTASLKQPSATDLGVRLASALGPFWHLSSRATEGREHLMRMLSQETPFPLTIARIKALTWAGRLATIQDDYAAARSFLAESLLLSRELRYGQGIAVALMYLGVVSWKQGDYAAARPLFEESLPLVREHGEVWHIAEALRYLGDPDLLPDDRARVISLLEESLALSQSIGDTIGMGHALLTVGYVAWLRGDQARAKQCWRQSLALFRAFGHTNGIAPALHALGWAAHAQGDPEQALRRFGEGLSSYRAVGHKEGMGLCLDGLGVVAAAKRHDLESVQRAARLFAAAQALRESIDATRQPIDQDIYEHALATVRSDLGEAIWTAAWTEGLAMTLEQAIAYAIEGAENT